MTQILKTDSAFGCPGLSKLLEKIMRAIGRATTRRRNVLLLKARQFVQYVKTQIDESAEIQRRVASARHKYRDRDFYQLRGLL